MKKTQKKKKVDSIGIVHVRSTFNNTIITITDLTGNTITWASGGNSGFKGSRKGTAFAAQRASLDAGTKANERGLKRITIKLNGPGPGRDAAIRGLKFTGLEIVAIEDQTPIQYNGCRPPKRRRI